MVALHITTFRRNSIFLTMTKHPPDKPLVDIICERITHFVFEGKLSNDDLVQIIEQTGDYLNICTRAEWSRRNGKSYNGGKNNRRNIKLFGANMIIDND